MKKRITKEDFAIIKAVGLPRIDWRDIFSPRDGKTYDDAVSAEDQQKLTEYFRQFADMGIVGNRYFALRDQCPGCLLYLEDTVLSFLGIGTDRNTSIQWSLTHGEAYCTSCYWPYRVYHYDIITDIKRLIFGLPYHPDELEMGED